MEKQLIAVYGSLRKGLHNHGLIEHSELLGTFNSKPEFSLYSLGSYPGLKPNGTTSVVMEVYAVDENTAKRVDRLEGYHPGEPATFYDKISIDTPWGIASVFIYVPRVSEDRLVESGDWKESRLESTLESRWLY